MKVCARCKDEKSFDNFCKCARAKDGLQPACKQCMAVSYNKSRKKDQIRYQQVAKDRQHRNIEWLKSFRQTCRCILCDESDDACLDFHHLDPTQKDGDVSDLIRSRSITGIKKEIEKCVVLCANCHRKFHAGKITLIGL